MTRLQKRCFDLTELSNAALVAHCGATAQTMTSSANEALRVLGSVGALSFMIVCMPNEDDIYYSLETSENVLIYSISELHGFKVCAVYSRYQFGQNFTHYKLNKIYHRNCDIPTDAEVIA